jgi:NAD-reducing hydrogenase small subunit
MRNQIAPRKLLERIYIEGAQENKGVPTDGVPALLRHAIPVHEVVKVDLYVPGCPPPAKAIAFVLSELLEGRVPDLTGKVKFG